MSNNKQKLELTWIGKNNPEYDISNIEPRILEENPELSKCKNDPNTENMIIHGDNLLALKALLPEYEGKIKCIYIDPPYNTGKAFKHYDDSVEHSTWLSLMRPRLEILKILLKDDGTIFVHIDDNEQAYLKIIMDEVFGRDNFVSAIPRITSFQRSGQESYMNVSHDYILCYSYSFDFNNVIERDLVNIEIKQDKNGKYIDGDTKAILAASSQGYSKGGDYDFEYNGKIYKPVDRNGIRNRWLWTIDRMKAAADLGILIETKNSLRMQIYLDKKFEEKTNKLINKKDKLIFHTADFMTGKEYSNPTAFNEIKNLFKDDPFDYPKPEKLLHDLIYMATEKNDLVLDSFLGSGTTAAVANKMERKYIGIEMGDHAYTHCKVRLDNVIDGSDQGGISKSVEWKGGGAYKFYELAPSFIIKDEFGNPIIDDFYDDAKLIKAMCKLMNFTYQPSQNEYWKHGVGQGRNFIYITTQFLTVGMIQQIAGHLGDGESLIICPKKFEHGAEKVDDRITVKKIPQSVLKACYFGKKEYLLPIKESSIEEIELESEEENN